MATPDNLKMFDPLKNDATMRQIRRDGAPGTGRVDPLDMSRNDPTMLAIKMRGAPSGSMGPMGSVSGAPSGAAAGGAGNVDAEMRPLEMMPAGGAGAAPGMLPMRAPMAMAPPMPGSRVGFSGMNRGVQPGFSTNGALSMRGARPMGRSMAEAPERRLETAARNGDMRAANALVDLKQAEVGRDFQREMDGVNFQQGLQMYGMQQQDQAARDERNFGQGLQMYGMQQQDQAARDERNFGQGMQMYGMQKADQAMRDEQNFGQGMQMYEMQKKDQAARDAAQMRQREAERAAGMQIQNVPIPGTNLLMPRTGGGDSVPNAPLLQMMPSPGAGVLRNPPAPKLVPVADDKASPWQLTDIEGPQVPHPYIPNMMIRGPKIKKQVNRTTGETRDLIPEGGKRGPGGGGYNPFAKPAAKPTAAVQDSKQTDIQIGQMPNEAYANDMSPLQSLAAAREHYAETGDDSKIRAHFQSNPSYAMQYLQRAQAADERGRQALVDEEYQQSQYEKASQNRDKYLAQQGANAFTVGHHSAAWARANPQLALDLGEKQSFAKEKTAALSEAQGAMADYGRQFEEDRQAIAAEDAKRALAMRGPLKGRKF